MKRTVRMMLAFSPALAMMAIVSACGSSGRDAAMTVLPTDADLVSYDPPYSGFGEIERLSPALNELIPIDAEPELLAEGFVWSEGPVWIDDGDYLLFSDIPPNSIYRWSEASGITLFMRPSGYDGNRTDIPEPGSNGLALDMDGALLLAEHGNRRIAKLETRAESGRAKLTIADEYAGQRISGRF